MAVGVQPHFAAEGRVVSNPAILGGCPVFAGTRVPVATLFEYLADGLALDYFLESFPSVLREQAVAVLRYGQKRIESDSAWPSAKRALGPEGWGNYAAGAV
jgi:uncharacterized protein (DUF433 family)